MTIAPPAGPRTRYGALLTTVFLLQFTVGLDMSLVNIALPAIQAELGFSAAGLQWVVNAYLLSFAGFMLVGGRLGDVWGRRPVVFVGLLVFGVASVAGGFATAPWLLVGARAIQGLAAAVLAPAALALVAQIDDEAMHKRAMGIWGGAGAAGGAVGVVASGLLTDWFDWRAVMFVNVPIVAATLVAALGGISVETKRSRARVDLLGGVLVTVGVAALVFAVTATGEYGWGSWRTLAGFAVAVILLTGFAIAERTGQHPLMPIRVLATRSIVGANAFGFMLAAGQLAAFYFCSLYAQTVWEVSPRLTGVLFLPFCAFVFVGIVLSSKIAPKLGPRNTIALLGLLGAVGLALFARMPDEFSFWTGILLPSLLAATGIGGSMVLIGTVGTAGVPPVDAGAASGVLNSSRQLGGTIGLAILVTIAAHYTVAADGYRMGLGVGAVFLVVASVAAWLILPRDQQRHEV
ncbi:putative drug resistance transporter [Gordonia effusa NBRC 100432]|uniref:Putative drug resistance transporter n=1 Tax=Gordonia effusa NBRC 100432 TaxID=1077974 RepID=H0R2K7_9ACTN|nr:MFS transporter [Gordonia effusa]GAB19308.1 putative drug resistance transporter [Gordonia effusa NBRC 100432]